MEPRREDLVIKFLRTYRHPFSLAEMKKVFEACGIPAEAQDVEFYLESNPNVMRLTNGKYLTHAGAFTGEIFSMMPTATEVEQGVLVAGDRCMPFVESDRISSTLKFYINGKKIPAKVGTFDSDFAIDMFMFFGEEYAPQYIAADPANADLNMAERDFELPNTVKLTGIDLDFLARNFNYKKGDRILCCVNDWDKGKLNLMVLHSGNSPFDKGAVGEKRLEWYSLLERKLMESFDSSGPLDSIESQIVDVFYKNRAKICVPYCGSLEEFMARYAKKIDFQHYGVETRLWFKGQDVPAFGEWNKDSALCTGAQKQNMSFEEYTISFVPPAVIDQFILNSQFKKIKDIPSSFVEFLFEPGYTVDDAFYRDIALNMKERIGIICQNYNWFADQILGPVRSRCLELYGKVSSLIRKIDFNGKTFLDFPSNELVILLQLHDHILKMLDGIASEPQAEDLAENYLLSLDGMEWNFEEISGALEGALAKEQKNRFTIVR
ncbi:MAG: hypothetical protein KBS64_06100 [Treponema sp.]|nr:hypothetical protein [Candidatus Treponema equi]